MDIDELLPVTWNSQRGRKVYDTYGEVNEIMGLKSCSQVPRGEAQIMLKHTRNKGMDRPMKRMNYSTLLRKSKKQMLLVLPSSELATLGQHLRHGVLWLAARSPSTVLFRPWANICIWGRYYVQLWKFYIKLPARTETCGLNMTGHINHLRDSGQYCCIPQETKMHLIWLDWTPNLKTSCTLDETEVRHCRCLWITCHWQWSCFVKAMWKMTFVESWSLLVWGQIAKKSCKISLVPKQQGAWLTLHRQKNLITIWMVWKRNGVIQREMP